MSYSWDHLMEMIGEEDFVITKVDFLKKKLSLEGEFSPPALSKLSKDEQAFIIHFIRVHGSIREMEQILKVSYPTIKAQLRKLTTKLTGEEQVEEENTKALILKKLSQKQLTVEEALEALKVCSP